MWIYDDMVVTFFQSDSAWKHHENFWHRFQLTAPPAAVWLVQVHDSATWLLSDFRSEFSFLSELSRGRGARSLFIQERKSFESDASCSCSETDGKNQLQTLSLIHVQVRI